MGLGLSIYTYKNNPGKRNGALITPYMSSCLAGVIS